MKPTGEQNEIVRLFTGGGSMVVDALAGTGKTSTLRLLAYSTRRRGLYVAYNRAIVDDVRATLPERCGASTAHGLAYKAVGTDYGHRLRGARLRSWEVAKILGIYPIVVSDGLPKPRRLAPGWMAGLVMRAIGRYCNSADVIPSIEHFPLVEALDPPDDRGHRTWANNRYLQLELEGALHKAWQDLQNTGGGLRFTHDTYLKIWALTHPKITAEYILLDEAQDTNPVLAGVIAEQTETQVVLVGDANQQLYEWRGAVDAMAGFDQDVRRSLTRTFRFGPAIAAEANHILGLLGSDLRITPHDRESTVGEWWGPVDAILCRTNAVALEEVLGAQLRGQRVHLVGAGTEIAAFARAVQQLKDHGRTSHPELAPFESWGEVKEYVRSDPDGGELALFVRLVEDFGIDTILRAVDATVDKVVPGTLTVSTGHRAKGRQWPVVRIAQDFVDRAESDAELRLRYVAFTRAIEHLDHSAFLRPNAMTTTARDDRPVLAEEWQEA